MRCPECNRFQKYKEGMRCRSCGYKYVFNPKSDSMRDNILRNIIDKVSDKYQYAFTRNQLAVEICRYWGRGRRRWGLIVFVVLTTVLVVGWVQIDLSVFWITVFALSIIGLSIIFAILGKIILPKCTSFTEALKVIQRYDKAHPIKLLASGSAFVEAAHPVDDDFHYAPDRILVVERNDLVDMLIRNRFHQDTKTAVVSQEGYPNYIYAACQSFLTNHPRLPILVAHDGSPLGYRRVGQLRRSGNWSFVQGKLIDIGLFKEQIQAYGADLPWQDGRGRRLRFTDKHKKMVTESHTLRIDFLAPRMLLTVLTSAMASGVIALPATVDQGAGGTDNYG